MKYLKKFESFDYQAIDENLLTTFITRVKEFFSPVKYIKEGQEACTKVIESGVKDKSLNDKITEKLNTIVELFKKLGKDSLDLIKRIVKFFSSGKKVDSMKNAAESTEPVLESEQKSETENTKKIEDRILSFLKKIFGDNIIRGIIDLVVNIIGLALLVLAASIVYKYVSNSGINVMDNVVRRNDFEFAGKGGGVEAYKEYFSALQLAAKTNWIVFCYQIGGVISGLLIWGLTKLGIKLMSNKKDNDN